jgi:hypothetical protein
MYPGYTCSAQEKVLITSRATIIVLQYKFVSLHVDMHFYACCSFWWGYSSLLHLYI